MKVRTGLALELKIARITKGLTQYELSKIIDEPTYNITRYECGLAVPAPRALAKIKKALGLDASVN